MRLNYSPRESNIIFFEILIFASLSFSSVLELDSVGGDISILSIHRVVWFEQICKFSSVIAYSHLRVADAWIYQRQRALLLRLVSKWSISIVPTGNSSNRWRLRLHSLILSTVLVALTWYDSREAAISINLIVINDFNRAIRCISVVRDY